MREDHYGTPVGALLSTIAAIMLVIAAAFPFILIALSTSDIPARGNAELIAAREERAP